MTHPRMTAAREVTRSQRLAFWALALLGSYGIINIFRLESALPALAELPAAGFLGGLLTGLYAFGLPALAAPVFRPEERDSVCGRRAGEAAAVGMR